ncbi:MAG: hypothetical protein NXH82_11830 [Rhodobacteraceae bacterium]|nr:hypothetical protein [Paracoccaceae bacterium]
MTTQGSSTLRLLAACICALATAAPAWAYRAENYHLVNPVGPETFEVIGRAGSGPTQYWCAAGDYALRVLGAAPQTRIYITGPVGPSATRPGARAVTFSLAAPDTVAPQRYDLSVRRTGDALSAIFARQYCLENRVID